MSGEAQVTLKVQGGETKTVDLSEASSVAAAKRVLNLGSGYTAMVNGQPASDGDTIPAYGFVTFSPAIKGGLN